MIFIVLFAMCAAHIRQSDPAAMKVIYIVAMLFSLVMISLATYWFACRLLQ